MAKKLTKFILPEKDMPTSWYNILPDLPEPLPPILHPQTHEPTILPPPLFPSTLNDQEFSKEHFIEIPDEVLDVYKMYRPTPLIRAYRLEKALGTPAQIFYKYEGVSPAGSHKLNTAIAQAYYNKKAGLKQVSYNQKLYRRIMMETWGAKVVASPSTDTNFGKQVLAEDPNCPGSLGMAISEACEDAFSRDDTSYSLGSVLNHVILHQSIIGLETKKQLEMADVEADIIIGCVGGGSNFGGLAVPFVKDKMKGKKIEIIAVEPTACPSMTKGPLAWDLGDVAGMAPIVMMYTLGHSFIPSPIHAGGLRYHGMSPLVSHLHKLKLIDARAVNQKATFESAIQFARTEGIIPAPEPSHAIKVTIDEALKCKESGQKKVIVLGLSGHGHFDLSAYEQFLSGKLEADAYDEAKVKQALAQLPKIDYVAPK
ncbi:MAG: TrpB-like pyridoxal phosphate-dependent enzyme [Chloroflexi bacterium]|nr:TrpB-like pyridoxal phosphate-dependent enzyme [Chloroflexota bacterium]